MHLLQPGPHCPDPTVRHHRVPSPGQRLTHTTAFPPRRGRLRRGTVLAARPGGLPCGLLPGLPVLRTRLRCAVDPPTLTTKAVPARADPLGAGIGHFGLGG